jgi:glutathione S-transferase
MSLTFYERLGHEGRRPSPFSWRIRYALAHKGIEADVVPVRFGDAGLIEELSGQRFVPVIDDGGTVIADSWAIACHLDDRYSDAPPLMAGEMGRALTRMINAWVDTMMQPALRPLIYDHFENVLDEDGRAYFRESREAMLGMTFEELCEGREQHLASFHNLIEPLRKTLASTPFVAGEAPAYADYAVFSAFQMARLGSPQEILEPDDPVADWRGRMVGLYDNLGDRFPGYPEG